MAFENVVNATPMTASVIIDATMSSVIVKPLSELVVRMSVTSLTRTTRCRQSADTSGTTSQPGTES